VFGDHARRVAVSSTKSMTGHMLGAAGGTEAMFSVLAIRDGVAPPTINLENPGEGCDLDYVPNVAREMPIDVVMSNSFGFGGTNGTLIFSRFRARPGHAHRLPAPVAGFRAGPPGPVAGAPRPFSLPPGQRGARPAWRIQPAAVRDGAKLTRRSAKPRKGPARAATFFERLESWYREEAGPAATAAPMPMDDVGSELPFAGGWFLYLGYEMAAEVEPKLTLPRNPTGLPDAIAHRCPAAVVIRHGGGAGVTAGPRGRGGGVAELLADVLERVRRRRGRKRRSCGEASNLACNWTADRRDRGGSAALRGLGAPHSRIPARRETCSR
jgi:hypothetical protein